MNDNNNNNRFKNNRMFIKLKMAVKSFFWEQGPELSNVNNAFQKSMIIFHIGKLLY